MCVRITRMDNVDVGLFDRDWNNTIYFFILNADEQIYLRYGGRDSTSPDSYLHLTSLELALNQGLELHRRYQRGELKTTDRPKPLFPREIPLLVERTFSRHACVECHLIGDFQNLEREQAGSLDKVKHLYRSPDIKSLGIYLDVPKGLVVKESRGSAAACGIKTGDRIRSLNGTEVWTYADFQYRYDQVERRAERIALAVEREGATVELAIELPRLWWWTDLTFRQSSVEPRTYFSSRPLTEEEKVRHGLPSRGFASEVTRVDDFAKAMKTHELAVGDIVFGVDGVERDEFANTAEFYIKLRKKAGDSVMLDVLRDGRRSRMPLKTFRLGFRK